MPVPAAFDLRRVGWRLRDDAPFAEAGLAYPLLALPFGLPLAQWLHLTAAPRNRRQRTAMLGIDDALERARLLSLEFGEALGWGVSLDELATRVERLIERAEMMPRQRRIDALILDLAARDGFVAGRPLGLHPREFALVWRLADEPGRALASTTLLADVWRLSFRPETNSLAVHVSRLRRKLQVAGLDGLIETTPNGGYRLAVAAPAAQSDLPLDGSARLREEPLRVKT